MLLQVLQAGSLLDRLPAGVLRMLFENGEKVAALTGLRELENRLLAERAHQELLPVQRAISQAGAEVKPEVGQHGAQAILNMAVKRRRGWMSTRPADHRQDPG